MHGKLDQKTTLTLDLKFHFFHVKENFVGNKPHWISRKKKVWIFLSLQHFITTTKSLGSIIKLKNKTNVHPLIAIRITTLILS